MAAPEGQRDLQRGGITILVSLMLLVLLTIAAVGMSRNAFREAVASGTSRQGAMARNIADSGLEWSVFWLDPNNSSTATGAAAKLVAMKTALLSDETLSGVAWDVMSGSPASPTSYTPGSNTALTLASVTTLSGMVQAQTLSAGITRMGKLPITDSSQGSDYTPASGSETKTAPDLWAIRSDSRIAVGSVSFTHGKELWISTPVQ